MPPEASRGASTDGGELLVCIYYRVGHADAGRAIDAVREFQRTLGRRFALAQAEVLLRWEQTPAPSADAVPNDPSAVLEAPAGADATLMETYRLRTSAAGVTAFLGELDACASGLAGLLRGTRHVELFRPCA